MPVDPWSLGPDVFVIASQSQIVVADAVQNDIETVEARPKPIAAGESRESSRMLSVPVSRSSVEFSTSQLVLQTPSTHILDSDTIFTVQLGTFLDRVKAQEFYDRATLVLGITGSIQGDWPFFRLRFGEYFSRNSADSLHRVAMSRGFYDARVLKITPVQ